MNLLSIANDKSYSFTDKIEISFKNIISVSTDKIFTNEDKGIRLPGLAIFNK